MSVLWDNASLIELSLPIPVGFAPKVDAKIDRDSVEPGVKRRVPPESLEIPIGLDECLLGDLPRILSISKETVGHGEDLSLVSLHKHLVGRLAAIDDQANEISVVQVL